MTGVARPEMLLTERVRRQLQAAIAAGEYRAGVRLPSERRLAEKYSVSRMTIRGALQELVATGVIQSEPGHGALVRGKKLDDPLGRPWSFTEERLSHGQTPRNRLLETTIVPASLELASIFGVLSGAPLVRIVRVRIADDVPMGLEEASLPSAIFPALESHDFEKESLYATLEAVYGARPTKARQTIEATQPTNEERRLLELGPRIPVLRVCRTSALPDNRVIEYVRSVWRGDRYLLTVESGISSP